VHFRVHEKGRWAGLWFRGMVMRMTKVVTAEYDAAHNTLRLVEPLDGVRDHEKVTVQVIATEEVGQTANSATMSLRGSLSKEAGEELSHIVNEMFPPWD